MAAATPLVGKHDWSSGSAPPDRFSGFSGLYRDEEERERVDEVMVVMLSTSRWRRCLGVGLGSNGEGECEREGKVSEICERDKSELRGGGSGKEKRKRDGGLAKWQVVIGG